MVSFFPSPAAAAAPFLVPFTLNFTITNLYYEEAMRTGGSWKFNSTERILQGQVRAPPTVVSPAPSALSPPTGASPAPSLLPCSQALDFLLTFLSPPLQLGPLFKNTSVGRLYSGCRLTLLR